MRQALWLVVFFMSIINTKGEKKGSLSKTVGGLSKTIEALLSFYEWSGVKAERDGNR